MKLAEIKAFELKKGDYISTTTKRNKDDCVSFCQGYIKEVTSKHVIFSNRKRGEVKVYIPRIDIVNVIEKGKYDKKEVSKDFFFCVHFNIT